MGDFVSNDLDGFSLHTINLSYPIWSRATSLVNIVLTRMNIRKAFCEGHRSMGVGLHSRKSLVYQDIELVSYWNQARERPSMTATPGGPHASGPGG